MTLCFAALIKVLKICAKPKVYNKTLCGAVVKSLDEYYGGILESDDSTVSHLLSCDYNLSPVDVVEPMQKMSMLALSQAMEKYVIPLIDPDKIPLAILTLQDLALSTVSSNEAKIGRLSRADLVLKVSFNPADFFADVFSFVATGIENKAGKETINLVTEDYVNGFEKNKGNIAIEETVFIETQELERNEYLFDSVGMYVYSRTKLKEFEDKKKARSIGAKALRLMKANGKPDEKGTGNELGEMLLFTFMEGSLHAPKLLSKVEITTGASQFKSKSDCVHLLKRKVNGVISYQLVFGTSSITGKIEDAIDCAFEALSAIKSGRTRERQMVDSTLFNHTYDQETTERLRQILVPSKQRQSDPDMAFGVFIGYSLDVIADDNDTFRALASDKMLSDIKAAIPYIEKKVSELNLGMHSYYFYFLPFNDAEKDKKEIMDELLLGGVH